MRSARRPSARSRTAPSRRRSPASPRRRSKRRSHRHPAAMAALDDLIAELERSYDEAQARMSDPAVYNDHREAAEVGRRLKKLEGPYKLAQQWRQARDDLDAARADPELAEMAADYEADVTRLEEELKLSLVERDPADEKDVIVEIRQGVGGDEAALWAGRARTDAAALRRAARLQVGAARGERERRRRHQGRRVRDQGQRRVLDLQVRGRHAPRAAGARRPSRRAASTRRPPRSP